MRKEEKRNVEVGHRKCFRDEMEKYLPEKKEMLKLSKIIFREQNSTEFSAEKSCLY